MDEIDEQTFAAKNTELPDRIALLTPKLDTDGRSRAEQGELALKVFEHSQVNAKSEMAYSRLPR